jgi:hypothetical protein
MFIQPKLPQKKISHNTNMFEVEKKDLEKENKQNTTLHLDVVKSSIDCFNEIKEKRNILVLYLND